MRIKRLNETLETNPINLDKLKKYALGISLCCAGEYGITFYKESENHIFICLGDSNPFDDSMLKEYILDSVEKDYSYRKQIKITIENECYAPGDDWKKYDPKSNEFKEWKYR